MPSNVKQTPAVKDKSYDNDKPEERTLIQRGRDFVKSVKQPTSMDKARKYGEVPE
jgi:hypothetical protein